MMLKVLGVIVLVSLAQSQENSDRCESFSYDRSLNFTASRANASALDEVQDNYDESLALRSRRSNFFCLERSTDTMTSDTEYMVSYTNYEQNPSYVWSIFVQFPLLAYLDTSRKRALIDVIVQILNTGSPPSNRPMNVYDVCLGPYDTYEVTTFEESVMIHIYGNGTQFDASEVSSHFVTQVNVLLRSDSDLVVSYPDQSDIIAFNLSASQYYNATKLHPGGRSSDGADPTLLAVFLASYGSNVTIDGETCVSRNLRESEIRELNFATNPNPVNYGLEPGDIIFAIIGSLLLVVVCAATIFGYAIHPFFFA